MKISNFERLILIKGIILSCLFHFIISSLPLKAYIRLLRPNPKPSNVKVNLQACNILIKKSIARIEKVVPWNCTCLNKTLIAKRLFKDFGINSDINLMLFCNDSGEKCAHASLLIENSFQYLALQKVKTYRVLYY